MIFMQECRFEFDTGYGNKANGFIFQNNNLSFKAILGGMLDLAWVNNETVIVIHAFHQKKSESIKWENYWMLEVISLLVSHVCTSVGSQSNSQSIIQSFIQLKKGL